MPAAWLNLPSLSVKNFKQDSGYTFQLRENPQRGFSLPRNARSPRSLRFARNHARLASIGEAGGSHF